MHVYNINTKSWKHPVSGFAKIQICSVLLVPPLVGHRTQTWYASTARWLSYCACWFYCLECYQCCVWSTPNLEFISCSYLHAITLPKSGDTSWKHSDFPSTALEGALNHHQWRTGWRCQLQSPRKNAGLIEESKSVTKVSNLRSFYPWSVLVTMRTYAICFF